VPKRSLQPKPRKLSFPLRRCLEIAGWTAVDEVPRRTIWHTEDPISKETYIFILQPLKQEQRGFLAKKRFRSPKVCTSYFSASSNF